MSPGDDDSMLMLAAQQLSAAQLRGRLEALGLATVGRKPVLVKRLVGGEIGRIAAAKSADLAVADVAPVPACEAPSSPGKLVPGGRLMRIGWEGPPAKARLLLPSSQRVWHAAKKAKAKAGGKKRPREPAAQYTPRPWKALGVVDEEERARRVADGTHKRLRAEQPHDSDSE